MDPELRRPCVTQALVGTGVAGKRHHEAFHRLFSRGTWDPDEMGRCLFERLERWTGTDSLRVALDDTPAPKKGPQVFGIGSHLDAVRSTKSQLEGSTSSARCAPTPS